ncbi:hypothetical protein ABH908_002304 [Pseudomonas frederiksbergensis]|jgi:hypothetical protein|uniref:Uncharacterized protein n=1 Tax=Pseudomonas umsongensis TaxID=198618 RepID=A0ACC5MEC3_9PSED|nr:hypothetical protein [Pseudomonas umsongensis]NMN78537.1 hypothetical protein [Pseudomonas sp. KD5]PZW63106.1 hypothetical protein F475_01728 [Pseudomonas sp. URMO17WK12:I6]CAH0172398.1 hypothetical protein SRABI123_01228 [Pseudomonas sp. Bi123]
MNMFLFLRYEGSVQRAQSYRNPMGVLALNS